MGSLVPIALPPSSPITKTLYSLALVSSLTHEFAQNALHARCSYINSFDRLVQLIRTLRALQGRWMMIILEVSRRKAMQDTAAGGSEGSEEKNDKGNGEQRQIRDREAPKPVVDGKTLAKKELRTTTSSKRVLARHHTLLSASISEKSRELPYTSLGSKNKTNKTEPRATTKPEPLGNKPFTSMYLAPYQYHSDVVEPKLSQLYLSKVLELLAPTLRRLVCAFPWISNDSQMKPFQKVLGSLKELQVFCSATVSFTNFVDLGNRWKDWPKVRVLALDFPGKVPYGNWVGWCRMPSLERIIFGRTLFVEDLDVKKYWREHTDGERKLELVSVSWEGRHIVYSGVESWRPTDKLTIRDVNTPVRFETPEAYMFERIMSGDETFQD